MKIAILIFSLVTLNLFEARADLFTGSYETQQKRVSGTVTDAQGNALPGVSVVVKGTTLGILTDVEGKYTIENVPQGSILVFSFVGMSTQEVPVDDRTLINIILQEESVTLEEVVVIGYGTQARKEVTSSIATIKEDNFLKGAITMSPLRLLSGKVAGVALSRPRGSDPTAGVEIQLRGVSSVRGTTAPLIVIDGIPGGSLDAIPPEDIQSIDILRDGSAGAIYGTRANDGVVIVTTKKGSTGKAQVEYSAYAFMEDYQNQPRNLTAEEFRYYKNELTNSDDLFLKNLGMAMADYGSNTNWWDVIRQDKVSQVHNLSISGGSGKTTYFGSLDYRNINGLIKETARSSLGSRLALTHSQLNDRLVINMNLSNTFITENSSSDEVYFQALTRNPTMPVYNKDRGENITYNPAGLLYEIVGYNTPNPLGLIENYTRDNKNQRFLGNTQVTFEIIKGLKASIMGAYQRVTSHNGYYELRDSWDSWTATQYYGVASKSSGNSEQRTIEPMLTYTKMFNNEHHLTALAGYSYQDFMDESFSAGNRTFLTDAYSYNNLGAGLAIGRGQYTSPVSSSKSSSKLIAFFGRVNYNFMEKYMLSASLRREGSSKFGADNKWGLFPAISVGWTISQESFMSNVNFIDNLKLRVGYGVTGNQGISNYLSLERLSTSGYMLYNGQWNPGVTPASNPNPNLRWEKKAETNIGIDLTMFKNITVNIDLYNRNTTDLLYEYSVPVPPNLYGRTWANVGKMNNRGVEFTINAIPVKTTQFVWNTNFNISYNKNKLVSLSNKDYAWSYLMIALPNAGRYGLSDETIYRVEEGQPIGNIYAWRDAGLDEENKWLVWDKTNTNKIKPVNATFEDRSVVGNGLPKMWVGFSNNLRYTNFDLDFTFRGAFFFDILNMIALHRSHPNILPGQTLLTTFTDPDIFKQRDDRNYLTSHFVEPGGYVKLENISLGYTVPQRALKGLRVYISGSNLFCLTKYSGIDPELAITGLSPGFDQYWTYPRTKTYSVGLNVKF